MKKRPGLAHMKNSSYPFGCFSLDSKTGFAMNRFSTLNSDSESPSCRLLKPRGRTLLLPRADTRLGSDALLSQRSSQSQVEPTGTRAMVKCPHQIDATVGSSQALL